MNESRPADIEVAGTSVRIRGTRYAVVLNPFDSYRGYAGTISVVPLLRDSSATDGSWMTLLRGDWHDPCFDPEDISVAETRLVCWWSPWRNDAPGFRQAFSLELEQGMSAALLTWLPRVHRCAIVGATIASTIQGALKRQLELNEHSAILAVAAARVYKELPPVVAIDNACFGDGTRVFRGESIKCRNLQDVDSAIRRANVLTLLSRATQNDPLWGVKKIAFCAVSDSNS